MAIQFVIDPGEGQLLLQSGVNLRQSHMQWTYIMWSSVAESDPHYFLGGRGGKDNGSGTTSFMVGSMVLLSERLRIKAQVLSEVAVWVDQFKAFVDIESSRSVSHSNLLYKKDQNVLDIQ